MVFVVIAGFGAMSQTTICLTIIQVHAAANMRGRVMSFLAMAIFGMLPLGSLISGNISHQFGARSTMFCQGVVALVIAGIFSRFLSSDRMKKKDVGRLEEAENLVVNEA